MVSVRNAGGNEQRQPTDVCTSFILEWCVVSTYLPLWPTGKHCWFYVCCKRHHRGQNPGQEVRHCSRSEESVVQQALDGTNRPGSALTSTCLYLNDSMPFFVDRTKKGCLSILVTWISPPLLSMAPEWMAALQMLDCWKHKRTSVGNTSGTRTGVGNKEWRDSPHRRKEFPTLSLSCSCNWRDIYTCRRRNESS